MTTGITILGLKGWDFGDVGDGVTAVGNEVVARPASLNQLERYAFPTTATWPDGDSIQYGWPTNSDGARPRNAGIDRRLTGIRFIANGGAGTLFQVDVGSTFTGTWNVYLAMGSATDTFQRVFWTLQDGSTVRNTVDLSPGGSTTGPAWYDATGTLYTSVASWIAGQTPVAITIASGVFKMLVGGSGTGNTLMSYLGLSPVASGPRVPDYAGLIARVQRNK